MSVEVAVPDEATRFRNRGRLLVDNLVAGYGRTPVLHGVNLCVEPGEVIAVLGSNGAGKSTLLRTISGALPIVSGRIEYDGASLGGLAPDAVLRRGIAHVLEGRHIFSSLSVSENLDLGSLTRPRSEATRTLAELYEIFPDLARYRRLSGDKLSGGQQQQLAIARALMARPRVLLLDEPSIGLAPRVISRLCEVLKEVVARFSTSVVLVEQTVWMARDLADRGYIIEHGRVIYDGVFTDLHGDALARAYLGAGAGSTQ